MGEFRICDDYGEWGFQFVRSIRYKLPLLHPRRLYRPYRPSGKQDADAEKYEEAKRADEAAGAEQSVQRRAFTGDIREHETMVQRHIRAVISQVIFLNDAKLFWRRKNSVYKIIQKIRVR